jgi:hypothetical protein
MRSLLLGILCLIFSGCGAGRAYLVDNAAEVNQKAFDGKLDYTIHYCDRDNNPGCWAHHGLCVINGKKADIHVSPEWLWESEWWMKGVIAHEMIHAYLEVSGLEKSEKNIHGWKFKEERRRVAAVLGIPVDAIPDGKRYDKLDATRTVAYLSWDLENMRRRMSGGLAIRDYSSAGWPGQAYDPEDE